MLTNKQRNYLRKMSHNLDTIYQIGKGGLVENTLKQFNSGLEARELIKAKVLNNSLVDAREVSEAIAEETGAEVVSVIGNKFVLYRESKKKKKIDLPKK